MSNKEIVARFFIEGYENKNYDFILDYVAEEYVDHSPANAKSNQEAVAILKCVSNMFAKIKIEILDMIEENGMVATRIRYHVIHVGECMGIEATGKQISFEALENFKVLNGKIIESWGYWPDKEIEQLLHS